MFLHRAQDGFKMNWPSKSREKSPACVNFWGPEGCPFLSMGHEGFKSPDWMKRGEKAPTPACKMSLVGVKKSRYIVQSGRAFFSCLLREACGITRKHSTSNKMS